MRQLKITKQITNRDAESFNKYLVDVNSIPLITQAEELELAKRIKSGDKIALDRLVESNLRFVISVAKQYSNQGMTLQDLIQEGNVGLTRAAERFDETRGFKFISYAVWWIRQSILQALAENGRSIRLPLNKLGVANKIKQANSELEQILQRLPSADEVSEFLIEREMNKPNGESGKFSEEKIKDLMTYSQHIGSLDAPIGGEDDSTSLGDVLHGEGENNINQILKNKDLQVEVERCISRLKYREKDVLILYFGLFDTTPLSLEEIGQKFGLTRERVRQIKEGAIRRLKFRATRTTLKEYI